jgi:hypothetical protein
MDDRLLSALPERSRDRADGLRPTDRLATIRKTVPLGT